MSTVRLWDAATGECLRRLTGHTGPVVAVAMGAVEDQPVVATAGDDGTVRLWDAGTGECLSVLEARSGGVRDVYLGTADGRPIVVGGMDRAVRAWDARTATPLVVIEGALDVNAVCAGPGATIAFACPAGFAVIRGG
jgi:WD40 repeat protein